MDDDLFREVGPPNGRRGRETDVMSGSRKCDELVELSAWGEESKALRVFASRCVPTPKVTVNSIEALALLAEI